jgi:hypothetical protein
VFAFISFSEEGGYEAAKSYESTSKIFLDHEINIKEATEPTDIIWENRHFTDEERKSRTKMVILSATCYLICALIVITALKYCGTLVSAKYPTSDCSLVEKQFGPKLQEYAFREYMNYYEKDVNSRLTGVL